MSNALAWAYFLPESLNVSGDVQTQILHRGIYDAAVFRAQVSVFQRRAAISATAAGLWLRLQA